MREVDRHTLDGSMDLLELGSKPAQVLGSKLALVLGSKPVPALVQDSKLVLVLDKLVHKDLRHNIRHRTSL